MRRARSFQPETPDLEGRMLLSNASIGGTTAVAPTEVLAVSAKSATLKLNGVSPWGFPTRGLPGPGAAIDFIGLGGRGQNLTANGVKVPNVGGNGISGKPVAIIGPTPAGKVFRLEFFGPSTLHLTTRKGDLTFDLTPVTPGGNKLAYSVASGTGVFSGVRGTGTITFGKLATFRSNR